MGEAAAISALGLTVFLAVSQPTIARRVVVGPALAAVAGVLVMLAAGHVSAEDVSESTEVLWRPLVGITAIMLTAAAARYLGILERLASRLVGRDGVSAQQLFLRIFVLSAATAALLNNDAAILLLTPLVVVVVRRVYPADPAALTPYVFAVFMAAGVAPLVTSNPMNLIVAEYADLDFNSYALAMAPVAMAGWMVTCAVLWLLFRGTLRSVDATHGVARDPGAGGLGAGWSRAQLEGLLFMLAVLASHPIASVAGVPVWLVAVTGAVGLSALCLRHGVVPLGTLLRTGISVEILVFLVGVFTIAIGLRNAGAIDWLTDRYTGAGLATVGVVSALGSAMINNHSMALTNLLVLGELPGVGDSVYLAALVGGDLGPRLLPMGSLAGLLWFVTLQRMQVAVTVRQFVVTGAIVTVPTLTVSLLVLELTT